MGLPTLLYPVLVIHPRGMHIAKSTTLAMIPWRKSKMAAVWICKLIDYVLMVPKQCWEQHTLWVSDDHFKVTLSFPWHNNFQCSMSILVADYRGLLTCSDLSHENHTAPAALDQFWHPAMMDKLAPNNYDMTLVFRLDKSLDGFPPNGINNAELLRFPARLKMSFSDCCQSWILSDMYVFSNIIKDYRADWRCHRRHVCTLCLPRHSLVGP